MIIHVDPFMAFAVIAILAGWNLLFGIRNHEIDKAIISTIGNMIGIFALLALSLLPVIFWGQP